MSGSPLLDMACIAPISEAGGCLIAVSGGADSVALAHNIRRWSMVSEKPLRLEMLHVNHQLRGADADADEEFVRELGQVWGVEVHVRETQPPSARPSGVTLEEFLRSERYACYTEVLRTTGLSVLAVGHTADDMVETFLMHLMRGAGLHGLSFAGVQTREFGCLTRPLWKSSRQAVLHYLKYQGLLWREDATNASTEFTRNRVRHVLLPMMEREFNPCVRDALVRSATVLSQAEEYIREQVKQRLGAMLAVSADPLVLPRSLFLATDAYIRGELVGEWVRGATQGRVRPGYDQVEQVMEAAARGRGRVSLSGRVTIAATEDALLIHRVEGDRLPADDGEGSDKAAYDAVARELAARYASSHPEQPLAWLPEPIGVALSSAQPEGAATVGLLDGTGLLITVKGVPVGGAGAPGIVEIRNRRAGDRVSRNVKFKSLLINDKVPAYVREHLILVADPDGQVCHIVGMERINARLRKRVPGCPVSVSYQRVKSGVD